MAGTFGLDPHRLDDEALERELCYLYATREETFFHGTRQALLNHTERMLQLEREYASRFPERTKPMPYGPARAPGSRRGSRPAGNQPATPARGSGGSAPYRSTERCCCAVPPTTSRRTLPRRSSPRSNTGGPGPKGLRQ
jgi:hypothetical protein